MLDTGTALVMGYRGDHVIVDGDDVRHCPEASIILIKTVICVSRSLPRIVCLRKQIQKTTCLHKSILSLTRDLNTNRFYSKGGGSANKAFLHQKQSCS